MSKTDNRPSHRVYAVTKNGERSFWQPIGAAWVHSDGWGFNVKIDYLPLNGAEIVIRKPKVEEIRSKTTTPGCPCVDSWRWVVGAFSNLGGQFCTMRPQQRRSHRAGREFRWDSWKGQENCAKSGTHALITNH